MKRISIIMLLFLLTAVMLYPQSNPPKREFRSAWIATVTNLDWPSRPGLPVEQQKAELVRLLDELHEININNVVFQVRTECDALYQSQYEPWSYWLTGSQGTPPSPFYDPLAFAVEEAHKRGMEIHAWFNPYRAIKTTGTYSIAQNHVTKQHPDWILSFPTAKLDMLDPGLPQVREHVTNVIMDVVRNYDIDGIHMDDYFYPYSPKVSTEDNATFANHSRGFTNRDDWRRDNINILLKQISDSVNAVKPWVKFGMSPFGIWKNGVPPGITGLDAYSQIYADAMAWLKDQSIDYLTPQLYWPHGGGQDYAKLMPWWADSVAKYNRHFYPGQALYRLTGWHISEMARQIRANRDNPKTTGQVFFRALSVRDNIKGFTDSLQNDLYRYPALLPVMSWKDNVAPNPIKNLRYERISGTAVSGLVWDTPDAAADGDSAYRYAVYSLPASNVTPADLENSENLIGVAGVKHFSPSRSNGNYVVVTALDRNYNESAMSTVFTVSAPAAAVLIEPVDDAVDQKDTTYLRWAYAERASGYILTVALDPEFSNVIVNKILADTVYALTETLGQTVYYWKVDAFNTAGSASSGIVNSFTTGYPTVPVQVSPAHATTDLPVNLTLTWNKEIFASEYRVQVAQAQTPTFNESTIVRDTVVSDTSAFITGLTLNRLYWWRIAAMNQSGSSAFTGGWGFKTQVSTDVEEEPGIPSEYDLNQNYPNPFNPETKIEFSLPESGFVTLKVYDVLGKEVAQLVSKELPAGRFSVMFDASKLTSGMYVYTLQAGDKYFSKKMLLIK